MYSYILALILCCVYVIWRLWFNNSHLDPPLLSGWLPIVGHGYKIMGNSQQMFKAIVQMTEECAEKGGVATFFLGPRKVYGVTDADDVMTILNTCLQRHFFFNFAKPLLGDGLLTADVNIWKKNRKLLNPAFNQQVLDGFIETFNVQAHKLVNEYANHVGKPFDQEKLMRINNLEMICATSLGITGDNTEYKDLLKVYLPSLLNIIRLMNERVKKFWLHNDYIFNLTSSKKQLEKEIRDISVLSNVIIQRNRAEKKTMLNGTNETIETKKFKPFISLLLDLADETGCFTDDHIRAETETAIAGGHDTSATVLIFTLALLGSHADVQEKAYNEIIEVLGSEKKSVEKEDLCNLVYLEAILKEVLRIYTVFPIIPRYIHEDIKLKNYTLQAGSDCFVYTFGLHRHHVWGPDADEFRPERWLDKDTLPDPKYYGAFGLGRRACIGKAYALMSMKVLLAHLLRRFVISSDVSKMVLEMPAMVRPLSGHHITLELRK